MEVILDKNYNPQDIEKKWYDFWIEKNVFSPDKGNNKRGRFSIVIPPPNVTGSLHMGHALTVTIEDIFVRWHRMRQERTLWLPGTDHAGIATQMVVERELAKEGITRHQLGRREFLKRVWEWKDKYGNRIIEQLKLLGASCDWSRLRFTLDEQLSRAVTRAFVLLFNEGLIYRDFRLINWCPRCQTALSDLEVDYEENIKGEMYSFAYPLCDGGEIIVATTRPETMLGDTAVAVHPEDVRYKHLIGKMIRHPILGYDLPIIADERLVDIGFGTGAVKVTPAHDFNDFETGKRHGLKNINILTDDGCINENGGKFKGMKVLEARRAVKEELKRLGLERGTKEHIMSIGRCQRCHEIVEPYLSTQWFVMTKPLAEPAIEAVEKGIVKIIPENWTKTYFHWMKNITDWCISRQLWWGHQIPAYYCTDCSRIPEDRNRIPVGAKPIVSEAEVKFCPLCNNSSIIRDPDVLDTWFSSALWPFSTLGWPDDTKDMRDFYPTDLMETGFDILFFWVARMMMMGIHFTNPGQPLDKRVPFRTIYLHAMVRDEKGQKMSKTKGNVIDPIDVTSKYGADALRFTLASMAAQGHDVKLSMERVEGYKHFGTKLYNSARFILMNLKDFHKVDLSLPLSCYDRYFLVRIKKLANCVNESLSNYRIDEAANSIYHFVWHEFCDWYLELAKPFIYQVEDKSRREATLSVLLVSLDYILRLLHPFMPFITEELWQKIRVFVDSRSDVLAEAEYPSSDAKEVDVDAERKTEKVIKIVSSLRTFRTEHQIDNLRKLRVLINKDLELDELEKISLIRLANIESIEKVDSRPHRSFVVPLLDVGLELYVSAEGTIDIEKEMNRLKKELDKTERDLELIRQKMSDNNFLSKAPPDVIEGTNLRFEELSKKVLRLRELVKEIEGIM
ncbi:MAG: valine--tRNA ligase [Deltaproteobacteria bacterium]|nr:valine--tRNA ligase [Deltaproteobacteria bacterium]